MFVALDIYSAAVHVSDWWQEIQPLLFYIFPDFKTIFTFYTIKQKT